MGIFKFNLKQFKGYIEKEVEKEGEILLDDADETCEAPKPKDMIPLEVKNNFNKKTNIFVFRTHFS